MISIRSKLKSNLVKLLSIIFVLQGLGIVPQAMIQQARAADCTSSQFTISLVSNPAFYFDSAKSIYSGYAQFLITNKTGSAISGYKAGLTRTAGSALNLATYESEKHPILI